MALKLAFFCDTTAKLSDFNLNLQQKEQTWLVRLKNFQRNDKKECISITEQTWIEKLQKYGWKVYP